MSIDNNVLGEAADMGLFAAAKKSRRYHMSLEMLEGCLERAARHSRAAGRLENVAEELDEMRQRVLDIYAAELRAAG